MYVIITYLVLAALITALGIVLFAGSIMIVLVETGAQAIANAVGLHAHVLSHARLRPDESTRRHEMHA